MDVKLPKLGEGADSGTVVSVLVKEGDSVTEGQTLLELENEKAVAPIPCPVSGTVARLRIKEGDKLSVGQVILTLTEGEGAKERPAEKAPAPSPEKEAQPPASDEARPVAAKAEAPAEAEEQEMGGVVPVAAPSIRKMARELGIDLKRVRGSEPGGRIALADVRAYIQRLQKLAAQAQAPAQKAPSPTPAAEPIDFSKWGPVSKKPMSTLRKTISRRMAESWNVVPHVTQFDEADITELMELRKKHAAAYEKQGAKLTITPFALKAVVATLRKHPIFNSSLDEASQETVFKEYYHIGVAVDTDQGLIVPVVRDVDKKGLLELAREVNDLAEKARQRKVSLEELRGGTFTISNQGGIGGAHFTPIINRPEAAILGLGRAAAKAVIQEKQIAQRLMLPLCVSYDHRLIDGGLAARFIVDLVQAFQSFTEADLKP